MASQPTLPPSPAAHPAASVAPAAPMNGGAPAAIRAQREGIPEQVAPGTQPVAQPVAQPAPAQPAPAQPVAQPAPVQPANDTFVEDPAIAAFLQEAEPAPAPTNAPVGPTFAMPTEPVQPVQPVQPVATSFQDLFAPVQTPESQPAQQQESEQVAGLRQQIEQLTGMLQNRSQPGGVQYDLSDDERSTFSESLPVIERVARAHAEAAVGAVLDRLDAIEEALDTSVQQVNSRFEQAQHQGYSQQLRTQLPDIDTLTSHPHFQAYMAQEVPYSGGRILKDVLGTAHRKGDLPTVVSIMTEFRTRAAGVTPEGAAQDALVQPATSIAPVAPSAEQQPLQKQKLPWSKRQHAHREFRAGRLTQEKFNRIDQAYRNAEAQSLVDYDN